jgi:aspartyl-tRNA(Asn)/glutamyl-tRNA(Gln) amidotransferase subunit A
LKLRRFQFQRFEYALAAYYVIAPAEISSNLARYDGIRYGHKTEGASNLAEVYASSRQEGFNAENKRRILIGAYVLSSGYYDAYYKKAQQVRTLLIKAFEKAFEKYGALLGPVAPTTAFEIGANTNDPLSMYLIDIMTVTPSLIGASAASVPVGVGAGSGLPIGLQIICQHGNDDLTLSLSTLVESELRN